MESSYFTNEVLEKLNGFNEGFLYHFVHDPFFLMISNKNSIKKIKDAHFFHADFTFKVCKPDMTILIIGFSDATRKFHPLSIIITRNEYFEVFKSAIIKLKEWCDINDVKMTIRTMTTDMGKQFKVF